MKTKNNKNTIGYAIGRSNWYLRTLFNKLLKEEGINLTNEQWTVLKIISTYPALSQTEIAENSLKDKTNVTRILDVLEKNNYIARQRDENDRRKYQILLTTAGKNILEDVWPVAKKLEKICTGNMNENEVNNLISSLDSICNKIKKYL